jgi:hypothetical protein
MWSEPTVENLLRECLSKPYQCARGRIGYSWRKWKLTGRCVVTILPSERGWSDPATFKLFADIRALGWGLVVKQHEWARPGIKEVVIIPPPERRSRDMERPGPIFDHATLGTKEPGDPELKGHDPGHPWYYVLGGRPLKLDEIEPDFEWELPSDARLERLKGSAKKVKRLLEMKDEYENRLQRDIERYQEVTNPGFKIGQYDRMLGYGLETTLFLSHNHILSSKAWLAAINRELEKYQPPSLKGILDREWVPSVIHRAKEQLRLF